MELLGLPTIDIILFFIAAYYIIYRVLDFFLLLRSTKFIKANPALKRVENDYFLSSCDSLPEISIIIPFHNEDHVVLNTIYSALNQKYSNFEVIAVDDGSTNNLSERVASSYDMKKQEIKASSPLSEIKFFQNFQSTKFSNLRLIIKEHSGKADSLNFASTLARGKYLLFLDADTILSEQALLAFANQILRDDIPAKMYGSIIKTSNKNDFFRGKATSSEIKNCSLSLFQEIEYLSSIFFNRVAFCTLDCNVLVSGATMLIERNTFYEVEGFCSDTITEDFDICLKVVNYCKRHNIPSIKYLPHSISSTEVPFKVRHFLSQRARWFSGLIKTIFKHRHMLLNPKFGKVGMLTLPYYAFLVAPNSLLFLFSLSLLFTLQLKGLLFVLFSLMLINILNNLFAIYIDEVYLENKRPISHVLKLVLTSLLYPIFYTPLEKLSNIMGLIKIIKSPLTWGNKTRKI